MPPWVMVVGAVFFLFVFDNSGVATNVIYYQRSISTNSHKINRKPCSVNLLEGTCMFVWECINTEGRHIGMCVDTFMFGSCCAYNLTNIQISQITDTSEPAVLFTQSNKQSAGRPSRPRPRPTTTTTSRPMIMHYPPNKEADSRPSSSNGRPVNNDPRPNNIDRTQNNNVWTSSGRPPSQYFHSPVHMMNSSIIINTKLNITTSHKQQPLWATITPSASNTQVISSFPIQIDVKPASINSKPSQHFNNSSQLTTSTTDKYSLSNQNWESNEIEDVSSNHIDNKPNPFEYRPSWQTSTESPFITKTKPWSKPYTTTNKPTTTSTTTTPIPSTTTTAATTTTTTTTIKPVVSITTPIPVSASSSDKVTQCGISPLHPRHEVRIVGGKNAQFGVWAWQVSVRRTSFFGFSSTHRCGGALLNENWIATAGHCVDDLLITQIRIRVGEYDFSNIQEPYPFAERAVVKKVVHPKYNFFTYEFDLALVRLETPLEYAPHIVPICLPGSDDLLIGENGTVTGWGRLSEGGTLPSVLQEVSVPIVSNEKCKSMFLKAGRQEYIPEIFMCAGFDNGGRDSCQGDSGGPLQVKGKDGRYFLAGIISWGIGCAEANLPGVCTRISKFVPWILQTVT